jgi:hypothetical protein
MKHIIIVLIFFTLTNHVKAQDVNSKIQEVYGAYAQTEVFNNPSRLNEVNNIITKRVKVLEVALNSEDKYPKLSQIGLLNKYNPNLSREIVFDPNNFNPLKYNFNFSSKSTLIYRIDNTNYIVVIEPLVLNK